MKNTISSLALLTSNWRVNKRDYIENFVPLLAKLIKNKNYEYINIDTLCNDFAQEYGLLIPYFPMHTILIRAKKRGLIKKLNNKFLPVKDKIREFDPSSIADEHLRKQEKIITDLVTYANQKYHQEITHEKAEENFISFLKTYDLDIIFASEKESILPEVSIIKKDKFLVYSFIKHTFELESETFKFIVAAAIGHLMANTILYQDLNKYIGKLKGLRFYIDTRFILRLLGLEGPQREIVYSEFLKTLSKEGACLNIFQHTYDETNELLDDCLNWVENPAYDPSKATRVLQFFVEEGYSKLDITYFINKIEKIIEDYGIRKGNIVKIPDKTLNTDYQIDENKLQEIIIETYKYFDPFFDEINKERSLKRDVDSIAAVYKYRKGENPRHLKDAGHIFMTTNVGLATAVKKFEKMTSENTTLNYNIPVCVTDTFIGTLLWLQSPAKILEINERKIIADCYAALKPDSKLIKKYISEVIKFKNENKIDQDMYYMMRRDSVFFDLLEEKTMGDPDNFDGNVLSEIIDGVRTSLSEKERIKYLEELKKHRATSQELDIVSKENKDLKYSLDRSAGQISKYISNFLGFIIVLVLIFGILIQFQPKLINYSLQKYIFFVNLLLVAVNIIYGFNIIGIKNKFKENLKMKIIYFINKK